MHERRGFTLIELLVVIAIIALLMAILMPSLQRAQHQAKTVTCQALLNQWGHIWLMYCQDNDGYFCECGDLGWKRGTWVIALRPQYRTRSGILKCPMAVKRRLGPGGNLAEYGGPFNSYVMGPRGIYDRQEESSYGANNWLYNPTPGQTGNIQGRPIEWNWKTMHVKGANNIPIFADTMWRGGGPYEVGTRGDPPEFGGQWVDYDREMKHFCIDRHNGFVNHLFMDWSVRKIGLKELWKLKWHRQFDTNGPWTKTGGVQPADWPQWMGNFKEY